MSGRGRPSSPALDARLGEPIPLLDHGMLLPTDYMGNDLSIVQAARVSYGEGTKTVRDDEALIRYLMRHRHTSPFEMCVIKLHIAAPVFVARQWIRHRTGSTGPDKIASLNEQSARFSVMKDVFYIPAPERMKAQDTFNKQGSGNALPPEKAERARQIMEKVHQDSYSAYELLLSDEIGLSRELARGVLPHDLYVEWVWKMDLHNLLHFMKLRMDDKAQYEIRVYAEAAFELVKAWAPMATKAFEEYQLYGAHLSRAGMAWVKARLAGESTAGLLDHMSAGERREFFALLGVDGADA